MGFSRLQVYQGYRRRTWGLVSQGYKAIKATGGGCRDMFLKATRLQEGDAGMSFSRLQGYRGYRRDEFLKATRLSRPLKGEAGICFSRLQGYQGY